MYKLSFYIPSLHLEQVKKVLFDKGAGRIGRYDQCCWQVLGEGQFRPLTGSAPFVGEEEVLEIVPEYKVEMVCEDHFIIEVVQALVEAHPYQEPAYEVQKILTIDDFIEKP